MTPIHDRRWFLKLGAVTGVTATTGFALTRVLDPSAVTVPASVRGQATKSSVPASAPPATAEAGTGNILSPVDQRVLVVIELEGGNDGLSTLVPFGDGHFNDLRPTLAPAPVDLIDLDGQWGLHASLGPLHERGLAIVEGLGVGPGIAHTDLSHFEMSRRWWTADPDGTQRPRLGFLGRLCDALDARSPITGVTMANRTTPALLADHASTGTLPDPSGAWFMGDTADMYRRTFRDAVIDLGQGSAASGSSGSVPSDSNPMLRVARRNLGGAVQLADALIDLEPGTSTYPDSELARQLSIAAQVIDSEQGTRVIHLVQTGYDTHGNQADRHNVLMRDLGAAIAAFLDDIDSRGRKNQVLVATTSEFGRRPAQTGTGTDHGSSSLAMLCGPVRPGRYGAAPALDALDDNGNQVPELGIGDLYATVAEKWFELPTDEVMDFSAAPIEGVL